MAKNWKLSQGEKCQLPGWLLWASITSWIFTPQVLVASETQNCAFGFSSPWDNLKLCWPLCLFVGKPLCLSPYTKCPKGKNDDQVLGSFKELSFFPSKILAPWIVAALRVLQLFKEIKKFFLSSYFSWPQWKFLSDTSSFIIARSGTMLHLFNLVLMIFKLIETVVFPNPSLVFHEGTGIS